MAVEGEVPPLHGVLGLGFHQDVRLGEILAGEELRLDVDHLLPLEALGVGALGRDALQGVEEGVLGPPSQFAVAQQRGGVEDEGV